MTHSNDTDTIFSSYLEPTEKELHASLSEKLVRAFEKDGVEAHVERIIPSFHVIRFVCFVRANARELCSPQTEFSLTFELGAQVRVSYSDRCILNVDVERSHKYTPMLTDIIGAKNATANTFYKAVECKLPAIIGGTFEGKLLCIDLASLPHLIIGGSTGSGKSTVIASIILSLCTHRSPDEVRLLLADPKRIEFSYLDGKLPQLLHPVLSECREVLAALRWLIGETERRYDIFEKSGVPSIDKYNETAAQADKLYKIVFIIDEIADYMLTNRELEDHVMRIAQKSRAAGIHLIIATQRPAPDVLTGAIKANITSRIALNCCCQTDSISLLGTSGAEHLTRNGDMLINMPVAGDSVRAQAAYVSPSQMDGILDGIMKKYEKADTCRELADYIGNAMSSTSCEEDSEQTRRIWDFMKDDTFIDATDLAIQRGSVNAGALQRKLSIGYAKAISYLDMMEDLNLVQSTPGSSMRTVTATEDEWEDMKDSFRALFEAFSEQEYDDDGEDDEDEDTDSNSIFNTDDYLSMLDDIIKDLEEDDDGEDEPRGEPTPEILEDEAFRRAAEIVLDEGRAVASYLQKKLFIGYISACNLIAAMYDFGIIGDTDTPGVYKPIITREEWLDILKKYNIT